MITSHDALITPLPARAGAALVGREAELAALGAQWTAACLGEPRLVLVEGAGGMGKTALVERFLDGVQGATVLHVSGDECESAVGLGVADQLLRMAGEPAALLPATAVSQAARVDRHVTVGSLILHALDRLQSAGPVAVALDDAHWADAPSLAALLFAVRRLEHDRVLIILTAREDAEPWIPEGLRRAAGGRGGQTLRLGPLDASLLGELAIDLGLHLPAHALRRLWSHTEGNPLHARALLAELPAQAWLDGGALPAPRSFAALVGRRLARCPARCSARSRRSRCWGRAAQLGRGRPRGDRGSAAPHWTRPSSTICCDRRATAAGAR